MVAAVEISVEFTPKVLPNTTSAPTARTSVSAAGMAFRQTLVRKCPLIIFLFGSSARKNAGMPIVNILIRDTCEGSSGYVSINTTENRESRKEKIFLTRNKLAERWMLFTTRLPSSTTWGIQEKSDSSSTSWEA